MFKKYTSPTGNDIKNTVLYKNTSIWHYPEVGQAVREGAEWRGKVDGGGSRYDHYCKKRSIIGS